MYRTVVEELAEGKSKQEIVRRLVGQGHETVDAARFVDYADAALREYKESPDARSVMAGKYAKHTLFGALWAIGGTIVTLWTYSAAGPGDTYVIAWGAIGFGAVDFLWGLLNWIRYSS
jgi:hypothetical protein